ncbi:MAG: glycosyltransferase family 4 protein [Chitinophagaceae bacterium]|nr:glycosyltransferase family 4 protein [Chitinophagaceae bacterium]
MKILHIAFSGLGGHGNVFFSMADADKEKQHRFEIIFFGNEEVREGYIQKAKQRNIPWYFVKKRPGFDFESYRQIEKIIRQTMPDIIFLHSSSYIFPVKKAILSIGKKIKIIVRETQPNHLKTKLNWLGLCVSLMTATKVVFLSTEYRDVIKKKLSLFFSDKRTAVIPNGVDLDVYKPAEKSVHTGINIGMQSRLSETKDHTTLIDAFARVLQSMTDSTAKLYIAGDGVCKAALEKQVRDLNISHAVEFTGMLEETDLPQFINSLDIYVHATLGETMSTAIMQVMACRMPVIASDVLGVNNMIKHKGNGLLVPAKDPEALFTAIVQLMKDPKLSAELAANAFTFATENYSNKKMLQRYNEIFLD